MGFQNLKQDKRGLEFKNAFFALIAVSMVVIAMGIWVGEWDSGYDSDLEWDLDSFDNLDGTTSEISSQQGNISVRSAPQDEEFESTSIRAVFGILNQIYKPFQVVFGNNGMLDSVTERFGLPDYIRQGLVAMMVVAITFALVAIFFRLPRRSA